MTPYMRAFLGRLFDVHRLILPLELSIDHYCCRSNILVECHLTFLRGSGRGIAQESLWCDPSAVFPAAPPDHQILDGALTGFERLPDVESHEIRIVIPHNARLRAARMDLNEFRGRGRLSLIDQHVHLFAREPDTLRQGIVDDVIGAGTRLNARFPNSGEQRTGYFLR